MPVSCKTLGMRPQKQSVSVRLIYISYLCGDGLSPAPQFSFHPYIHDICTYFIHYEYVSYARKFRLAVFYSSVLILLFSSKRKTNRFGSEFAIARNKTFNPRMLEGRSFYCLVKHGAHTQRCNSAPVFERLKNTHHYNTFDMYIFSQFCNIEA